MKARKNPHHNQNDDHDMTEFETRFSDRIHDSVIDLPPAKGPDAAVDRAHARSRHRRGVLAGAAALALVAGVVGQTVTDDDPDAGLDTAGTMDINNNGVNLDWQVTDDGLSNVRSFSGTDSGLYAVSTAPGTRYEDYPNGNVPRAMYRLADDGTWTSVNLDEDAAPASVSERGSTLYTLSTAPDTGQPVGSVSTDGGDTWSEVPLAAIEPPSNDVSWGMHYQLDLASTDDITYALVTAQFYLPADELFEQLDDPSGAYYLDYAEEGVRLLRATGDAHELTEEEVEALEAQGLEPGEETVEYADPDSTTTSEPRAAGGSVGGGEGSDEVVRTVPWSDLGITGEADLGPRSNAYLVDGGSWAEVDPPVVASGNLLSTLSSTDGHLVLSANAWDWQDPEGGATVLHSADGVEWVQADAPAPGVTAASPAGLIHMAEAPANDLVLSASTDLGATWREIDLAGVDPRIEDLSDQASRMVFGGPLGVGIILGDWDDNGPTASLFAFSADLTSWTVTDLSEVSPGSELFGSAMIGTDRVVVQGSKLTGGEDVPAETQTLIATPTR